MKIEINNTLLDMFYEGIYNGYQHPGLDDEDNVEDVDHNSDDATDAAQNNEKQNSQQTNN